MSTPISPPPPRKSGTLGGGVGAQSVWMGTQGFKWSFGGELPPPPPCPMEGWLILWVGSWVHMGPWACGFILYYVRCDSILADKWAVHGVFSFSKESLPPFCMEGRGRSRGHHMYPHWGAGIARAQLWAYGRRLCLQQVAGLQFGVPGNNCCKQDPASPVTKERNRGLVCSMQP